MSKEKKALERADVPPELGLGTREDVAVLARRIKMVIPGGSKLSDEQTMVAAQYAIANNINLTSDIWLWPDPKTGQVVFGDKYTVMVSWAKSKGDFRKRFRRLTLDEKANEGLQPEDIAVWCWILREDKMHLIKEFQEMGANFGEAYDMVATRAIGVVTHQDDMWNKKYKREQAPPKGWTWAQRAEVRALKNAIRAEYGKPTPAEMAQRSWIVDGVETVPSDWEDVTEESPRLAAKAAALNAQDRERREKHPPEKQDAGAAFEDLFDEAPSWGRSEVVEEAEDEDDAGTEANPQLL
ncbi:MAG: hypothetical protein DRQ02_01335 [Candidatus Latescibacterota bacterium]|nr:MAG: hypothetical protein DRQ02_01335 [Candidatus Latescibacterota bacterium]